MIIISNHVKSLGMEYPPESIIRINLAWVKSVEEAEAIIAGSDHQIFLDYPTGRTKSPLPTISLMDALDITMNFRERVRYFAFSNAEDCNFIALIRKDCPPEVDLVPKIETLRGVERLADIVWAAKTKTIMLDQEDLFSSCGNNSVLCESKKLEVLEWCRLNGVHCLRLQGVIFA